MINFNNNSIYIIMYHYIRDKKKDKFPNLKSLEFSQFKKQINFFKKKFNILGYEEFNEILKTKKIPKKPSILLTFDDGYNDHYKYALPLLSKEKIQGFFYPVIKTLENKIILDVNKIHLILEKENNKRKIIYEMNLLLKKHMNKQLDQLDLSSIDLKSRFDNKETMMIKRCLQYFLPQKIRNKILDKLFFKILGKTESDISKEIYINKKKILEMSSEKMIFGIHGEYHLRWDKINIKELYKEIDNSVSFFNKIGLDKKNFSVVYPYGFHNSQTLKIIREKKFLFGLTTKPQEINKNNINNKYILPRFDANDFKL
jgi:peptidoglycan/xylan/chitin deacetylase (PgdA/CDA1 family)